MILKCVKIIIIFLNENNISKPNIIHYIVSLYNNLSMEIFKSLYKIAMDHINECKLNKKLRFSEKWIIKSYSLS